MRIHFRAKDAHSTVKWMRTGPAYRGQQFCKYAVGLTLVSRPTNLLQPKMIIASEALSDCLYVRRTTTSHIVPF